MSQGSAPRGERTASNGPGSNGAERNAVDELVRRGSVHSDPGIRRLFASQPGEDPEIAHYDRIATLRGEEFAAIKPHIVDLLEEVVAFIQLYTVLRRVQAWTLSLYVLHTHAFSAAQSSPYLWIHSPEKRCGKTLLLRVLALLVRKPWRVVSPSEAVTFRKIERDQPTLELDEVDTIFRNKDHEPLRALLNAGNEADTVVPRCGGANRDKLHEFRIFCPKVLAGLGTLPETVDDRSIRIEMKRKAPGETVERFYRREAEAAAAPLRERIEAWPEAYIEQLAEARPEFPSELDDRAADGWECLLAIADLAGGEWPERARQAAIELSGGGRSDDESRGVRLLADIRSAFEQAGSDRLPSRLLHEYLNGLEESPWGDWYGKPLTGRSLSKLLKPYGIRVRTIRTEDGPVKGFLQEQFHDAFQRYLPSQELRGHNPHTERDNGSIESVTESNVLPIAGAPNPASEADCHGVTPTDGDEAA